MSTGTTIAIGRNRKVFAKKETVVGTLVIPAAGDMIVVNSAELQIPNFNFVEDGAARTFRSSFNRYSTNKPGAAFKLQHYVRPSGAAETAPEADCLFESAYGKKTVTGSTSVAYDPDTTQPSFSLYVKEDHTVYVAVGCVVDKLSIKKDNKSMLEAAEDGKVFSVIWTGTGALGEAISTTPAAGTEEWFLVDDVKKWCVGSHLLIDTEQIQVTGTYWEGTTGGTAGKIKMKRGHNSSSVATHLISAAITPWLPTGTETGVPLAARTGTLTIDAVAIPFLNVDYNLETGTTQNEEEVPTDPAVTTPSDYFEGAIKVSGKLSLYHRKTDKKWFADALKQTRKAMIINFGDTAGKKIAITNGYCEFDMPAKAGDMSVQKIDGGYTAYASAGHDETQLKFL
ncbi:MAG TPA: hypothetical protein DCS05_04230 [Nitrospiraceae bacterium]|nr:hypothetical protein [Nitrospiraceae bacterium]